MVAWSSTLIRSASQNIIKSQLLKSAPVIKNGAMQMQVRMSHNMFVQASRWQWHKTKDMFHFYFLIGAIPLSILTFCANIFVGPATLTEIPEGYEPKHWEYYRSPISRFLARYIYNTPQKDYEKNLHAIWTESQIMKIRKLEKQVWKIMEEKDDYKYNYFLPYDSFGAREFREVVKRTRDQID